MNIKTLYEYYKSCHGIVATDSRKCPRGSLFFALKGDQFDGNKYAESALAAGAAYAVVDDPAVIEKESVQYLLVHDTLFTLQQLANYHRQILQTPILAITGTNGKTTTKELIAHILMKSYRVHYTQGNFNNHIGVPLTLLSMTSKHELGVIEMGANHPGEIKELTRIIEPNLGLVTNVGKAHLEGFGSFEGVIKTKSELYDYLKTLRKGVAFVNNDDAILMNKAKGISKVITYGTSSRASIIGSILDSQLTLSIQWVYQEQETNPQTIKTQLIGDYNFSNILAAITVGDYFKVPLTQIKEAIETYQPTNNRSQLQETKRNKLIIDAYNANPSSMLASLQNFCKIKAKNKMIILGDMRELGNSSLEEHQKIVDFITKQQSVQSVVLIGSEFGETNHPFQHYPTTEDYKKQLMQHPISNATILIKGSNGIRLSQLVELL